MLSGQLAQQDSGRVRVGEKTHMSTGVTQHGHHMRQPHVVPLVFEISAEHPVVEKFAAFGCQQPIHIDLYGISARGRRQLEQARLSFEIQVWGLLVAERDAAWRPDASCHRTRSLRQLSLPAWWRF